MITQSYTSILTALPVETREKGSKFIGLAACCIDEKEVKLQLEEWHQEHSQATHICYAYRLGIEGELWRANDDGEPNNSAGAPIYGQILSSELTNVLVGVVRYYGGTKLGVGGLIQAYKQTAKEVLEGAIKKEYFLSDFYKIFVNFHDMPHVMNLLKRNRLEIESTNLSTHCELILKINPSDPIELNELLAIFESVEIEFIERK